MKLIKSNVLFHGTTEKSNCYIGFEKGVELFMVEKKKSKSDYFCELIRIDACVTPAIIYAHSHTVLVRSAEPACEDETNEHSNAILLLISSLHSIYMDDLSFRDSVKRVVHISALWTFQLYEIPLIVSNTKLS